jgi:hypothetical protein
VRCRGDTDETMRREKVRLVDDMHALSFEWRLIVAAKYAKARDLAQKSPGYLAKLLLYEWLFSIFREKPPPSFGLTLHRVPVVNCNH